MYNVEQDSREELITVWKSDDESRVK